MDSTVEELRREQRYFDTAAEHRERMRTSLGLAPGAAAHNGAAARLKKDAQARLERMGQPEEPVAFGRIDLEGGDVLYVGNHLIRDGSDVLVVNWQAAAAVPFYKASHTDPQGLWRKRTFECSTNTIESFSDTVFKQLAADVAELEAHDFIDDALLSDLESNRTGTMQDIVRTIQAAQFDLIRAPLDQLTVIQGGPGTGKTAVALHRVSWLLFNHHDRLFGEDVLIVGPNPTFTRYTRAVLPSLGDTSVEQRDINQLHPPVTKRGRVEDPAVVKLKGDGRMAGLLRRALDARVGLSPDQRRIDVSVDNRSVALSAGDLKPLIKQCRTRGGSYSERRQVLRTHLAELLAARAQTSQSRLRVPVDSLLDRLWPSLTAASFLRELFGSRDRLIAAAGDEFTAREVSQLHRRTAERLSDEVWSDADLALLDEAEGLINGIAGSYRHIVVDEAQDLSPMQLRAISRRSAGGSMTIVGDIAQSTGPWARDDWDEVLAHLPATLPHVREELRFGYRVPRQVFELAAQLLPVAAPTVQAPQIVRDGPADPTIHQIDEAERAKEAVRIAMGHAAHGRSVAIICPGSCRADTEHALNARDVAWRAASKGELGTGINLVSPQEAKGLEFDAVVVMEPEDIVAEDERGHRLLYVAMTRTTRYLDIVCVGSPLALDNDDEDDEEVSDKGPLDLESLMKSIDWAALGVDTQPAAASSPAPAAAQSSPSSAAPQQPNPAQQFIELGADIVVTLLRENVLPHHWKAVLARAAELLEE